MGEASGSLRRETIGETVTGGSLAGLSVRSPRRAPARTPAQAIQRRVLDRQCPAPGTYRIHTPTEGCGLLFGLRQDQLQFQALLVWQPGHRPDRPIEDLPLVRGVSVAERGSEVICVLPEASDGG
jgi:hypothetical protein